MASVFRYILFVVLLVSMVSADMVEPAMTAGELRIFRKHITTYQQAFQFGPAGGRTERPFLAHLSPAHPNLEKDALEHARAAGNGPYLIDRSKNVVYVSTRVLNNSRLGRVWNLAQREANNVLHAYDAHLFWRIDKNGPKLYRLSLFSPGAQLLQEQLTMQEAIERGRTQRGEGGCLGCF